MNRPKRPTCLSGAVVMDVTVGVVLVTLIGALALRGMFDYQRLTADADWNRAVLWAAQAQLQRVQAGAALDSQPPEGLLAEEIVLRTSSRPGQGQWEGFQCVTVAAEALAPTGRRVRAQVSGYVPAEVQP